MNDWLLMVIILILGVVTEFILLTIIRNPKIRKIVSVALWFVIAVILIFIWYMR
ncbi:MAG: hypothetical protein LRY73_09375 [Bacillus sp. (in: Bacteria)]|nr:hypothetical protein [Bacillus sp. (in: firmicutes)]